MNSSSRINKNIPLNAVDDTRRVRGALHRQFGGDIEKLCQHAHEVTEAYLKALKERAPIAELKKTKSATVRRTRSRRRFDSK